MSLYKARLYSQVIVSMKTIKRHDIQMSYSVLLNKKKKCRVAVPVIVKCGSYYDNRFYLTVEPCLTEYNRYTGKFDYYKTDRKGMATRLFV